MSSTEVRSLLDECKTAVLTTIGRDGWPHSTAMWFVPGSDAVRMWTYAKSQKAINLGRDPRFTLLIESGTAYDRLKGVMVRGRARLFKDLNEVTAVGKDLHARYVAGEPADHPIDAASLAAIEQQAPKRVGLHLPFGRVASWDHSKL